MSFDIVVWLSCTVALPAALPDSNEWQHWKASAEQLASMPKDLAAMLDGSESWDLDRSTFILRASYASKEPLGWEHLAKAEPGIEFRVINVERPEVSESQISAEARAHAVYRTRVQNAKMGVSLVLEGSNELGMDLQEGVARHLARVCGGALLEMPNGFHELDKDGKDKK